MVLVSVVIEIVGVDLGVVEVYTEVAVVGSDVSIASPLPMVTVVGSCVVTAVSSPPPLPLFTASLLETFEKIAVFTVVFELEVTNKPT